MSTNIDLYRREIMRFGLEAANERRIRLIVAATGPFLHKDIVTIIGAYVCADPCMYMSIIAAWSTMAKFQHRHMILLLDPFGCGFDRSTLIIQSAGNEYGAMNADSFDLFHLLIGECDGGFDWFTRTMPPEDVGHFRELLAALWAKLSADIACRCERPPPASRQN